MRKLILFIFILLQTISINTKAQMDCGSTFNAQSIQSTDPSRYNRFIQLEQHITSYINSINSGNPSGRLINPNSLIIIPVVVHVLHNGQPIGIGNNLADIQVQSQIDVLNEDFRRLNADAINTPGAFLGVAADPNIEFRLACVDPNGNATNGINRVQTNTNPFTVQFNANGTVDEQATGIKFTAQGGIDAWATERYLNMWVCNIAPSGNGQLLGYGQFPFDYAISPNTDGVVMLNTAFGRVGNLRFNSDLGRTATHEVGHWLNLFHIWGDDGNACNGTDQCDDTPNQGSDNQSNCPGFPNMSCNNNPNGDMFMNYMDYTVDGCKNIYTQGQANRMRAIFAQGGPRAAFIDNYFRINVLNTSVCNMGTVSVNNPNCLAVTWTVVSGPATVAGGQGTNTVTLQSSGNGSVVLRATAGGYIDEKTIYLGTPSIDESGYIVDGIYKPIKIWSGYPSDFNELCVGHEAITQFSIPGATSVSWTRSFASPTNTMWWQYGSEIKLYFYGLNQSQRFQINASNGCGSFVRSYAFRSKACSGGCNQFLVSPNPATNDINIIVPNIPPPCDDPPVISATGSGTKSSALTITEVRLYDNTGILKKVQKAKKAKQISMNITGLKAGIYFIEITDGTYKETQQLIIQK